MSAEGNLLVLEDLRQLSSSINDLNRRTDMLEDLDVMGKHGSERQRSMFPRQALRKAGFCR